MERFLVVLKIIRVIFWIFDRDGNGIPDWMEIDKKIEKVEKALMESD